MRRTTLNKQDTPKALRPALFVITMLLLPSTAWGEFYLSGEYNSTNSTWGAWTLNGVDGVSFGDKNQLILTVAAWNSKTVTITLPKPSEGTYVIQSINLEIPSSDYLSIQTATMNGDNISGNFSLDNQESPQANSYTPNPPIDWTGDIVITLVGDNSSSGSEKTFVLASASVYATTKNTATFSWPDAVSSANDYDVSGISKSVNEGTGAITLSGHCKEGTKYSFALTPSEGTHTISYSSSNPDNAAIDESTGVVTVRRTGTFTISASLTTDGVYYSTNSYSYTLNITEIDIPYNLTVAGVEVTSGNKDDILNDGGTVKFSPAGQDTPATLTLNGAVLTAPVIIGLSKITIDIQGTNSITTDETCIQKMENTTPLVTFKSTSAEGSLILTSTGTSTGVNNISNVTFSNELAVLLTVYGYDNYTSNTYYFTDGSTSVAKIVPSYGVQVESAQILQVYEGNAADVLKDGKVSFDKASSTLTLNNASGISTISTTLSSLNIELVGSNSLYRSSDGSIFDSSSGEAVTINLKSTGETKGTLTIETGSNSSAKFKGDNVTLTPVAPIVLLSGDLTTNSGTLEYGTLSAPTMSSETVDGVSTITLTSTADNSTIKYSIDYVDSEETDITDATYDSSSKPTVSKPATVTAKVTLNEVESATTTGKYFDTDPSPFTLISGADPVNLVLTPAIDESDGISITSISGVESNVTYDAGTGKISSSTVGSFNGQVSMSSTEGKTVILNNNFTATFTVQIDISDAVVTLDYDELTYNGKEQSVNVTKVMAGDIEVAADYYEVSDNSGTEVGNYKLTVTAKLKNSDGSDFKNNFTGTATAEFKIVYRKVTSEELGFSDSDSQPSGTYYSETEDLGVPDGMVAYIITGINGNSVTTQRVSYIPKGVAVLVEKGQSSESANDIIPYPSALPLKGTLEPVDVTSITDGTVYVLYNGEFVKSTSGTIPAHRCYLLVATNVASGTRSFGIDHGDGTTSLREVKSGEVKGEKWADGAWHDLQGRRLPAKPTNPGLYLHNGKKVVIK